MALAVYNVFNGGLNTKTDPRLLPAEYASALSDADVSTGVVKALLGTTARTETAPSDFSHYGTATRQAVRWFGQHYWTDNTAGGYGSTSGVFGVEPPATLCNLRHGTTLADTFYGSFSYCVTFETADGWESAPFRTADYYKRIDIRQSKYSGAEEWVDSTLYKRGRRVIDDDQYWECVVAHTGDGAGKMRPSSGESSTSYWHLLDSDVYTGSDNILLETIPVSTDSLVTKRNIYRTAESGSTFYRVATIENNVATTYTDTMTDAELLLRPELETLDLLPPPSLGKYLTEQDGVFWVAVDDKVYFSEQSNPHAWNTLWQVGLDATVTGMVAEFNGILAFTANRVYRITGTTVDTIAKQELPSRQGCTNWRTIATVNNAPVWKSNDGVCLWDGNTVQILTKDRYDITWTPTMAVAANDTYYLFHSAGFLAIDFRRGGVLYEGTTTADYAWYDADLDLLLLQTGSTIAEYGTGSALEWTWRGNWFPQNEQVSRLKYFRNFYVYSVGTVRVTIAVDGTTVLAEASGGTGRRKVFLPAGTRGYYAQVTVNGTGTLHEVAVEHYAAGNR